jgi:hypothetical protein
MKSTAKEFLEFNRGILNIRNEVTLLAKEETQQEFCKFYGEVLKINDIEALQQVHVDYTLTVLHDINQLDAKDYDTKTKLRALFVSVLIQRLITLRAMSIGIERLIADADIELIQFWPRFDSFSGSERTSIRDFYLVLREANKWRTNSKWEKFGARVASLAVNEGIWYCPGGGSTNHTSIRLEMFREFRSSIKFSQPKRIIKKPPVVTEENLSSSEEYDEDEDKLWCQHLSDHPQGSDAGTAEAVVQFIFQQERRDHPSFTRINFENNITQQQPSSGSSNESFLRSYITTKT